MAARRTARRRKAPALFGRELDRRRSLLWTGGCGLGAALFVAALLLLRREGVEAGAAGRLELWIAVGLLGGAALFFGTTALLLSLPEGRRGPAQPWLAASVALLYLAVVALPAEGLVSPVALTGDEWPLAIPLALGSLALGALFLHPAYPLRGFVAAAAIAFVLILPDLVGLLIELTGGMSSLVSGSAGRGIVAPSPESVWVYLAPEAAAARRASGLFLTWYLLLLLAAWAPLLWLLLRRRRRAARAE